VVVCPLGSAPKSSSPAFFLIDDAYVALKFGSPAAWLTTWAMGLPLTPQVTADFCSVDPPSDLPTTADWLKLAFPLIALPTGTYQRFANQIYADKWADLCQCNGSPGGACTDCTITLFDSECDSANSIFGSNSKYVHTGLFGCAAGSCGRSICFPSGQHQITLSFPSPSFAGKWELYSATVGEGVNQGVFGHTGDPASYTINWNTTDTGVTLVLRNDTTGNIPPAGINVRVQFKNVSTESPCTPVGPPYVPPSLPSTPSGFPSAPSAPTCGTSQDVCNAIQTLTNKLDWTRELVTLLQRQGVPFAYVKGATHTGLTGTGQFAVQGILGLSVSVTTMPFNVGSYADNPASYFDLGWLSFGTADGYERSLPIRHQHDLLLGVSPAVTLVAYSLPPGEVAAITELVREP